MLDSPVRFIKSIFFHSDVMKTSPKTEAATTLSVNKTSHNVNATELDKATREWQLSQIFKLQAEIALFAKQVVPAWNDNLVKDGVSIVASPKELPLPEKYAELWFQSWQGSKSIVLNHAGEQQDTLNWLLDKRAALRMSLCDYAKTDLPAMRDALGQTACYDASSRTDELWCESWKSCMDLFSLN